MKKTRHDNYPAFGLKYVKLSIFFFICFCLLTFLVWLHATDLLDLNTTIYLQATIPTQFNTFFSILSLVGSAEIMTALFLLLLLFHGSKLDKFTASAAYGLGLGIEIVGKVFLQHPGPPLSFFRYDLKFKFITAYIETGHSFPSGHAFRSVFIATIWLLFIFKHARFVRTRYFYKLIALTFCGIMLLSRVVLGEHWTSDVIGGSLLALVLAFGSQALAGKYLLKTKHPL